MKIRNGFVSNSSTSSFLIVGIDGDRFSMFNEKAKTIFDKVVEKLISSGKFGNPEEFYMGYGESEFVDGIAMWGWDEEPSYVGMVIEKELKAGKTLGELKSIFHKRMVENWGFSIPIEFIDLHYGECGSG